MQKILLLSAPVTLRNVKNILWRRAKKRDRKSCDKKMFFVLRSFVIVWRLFLLVCVADIKTNFTENFLSPYIFAPKARAEGEKRGENFSISLLDTCWTRKRPNLIKIISSIIITLSRLLWRFARDTETLSMTTN